MAIDDRNDDGLVRFVACNRIDRTKHLCAICNPQAIEQIL